MKKKLALILLVGIFAILCAFAGCDLPNEDSIDQEPSGDDEPTYTVTFICEGQENIVKTVAQNADLTDIPELPEKEHYTGAWNKSGEDFKGIIADMKVEAVYTPIEYKITFVADEFEVETITYTVESKTITEPAVPAKEGYTGVWAEYTLAYTQDQTVEAVYTVNAYKITFVDYNNKLISELTLNYGANIDYPADPSRESDNTYTYEFAGWDKNLTIVKGNETITATYTSTYIPYSVTFKSDDGTLIDEKNDYHYGDTIVVPENLSKAIDNTFEYAFKNWDKEVAATVTENVVYTAVFEKTYINYTIKFVRDDGTLIDEKTDYHYGDTVVQPANTDKLADNTYTYKFDGWDAEIVTVQGHKTYTAKYTKTYIDYTVIFKNEDGTELGNNTYHYDDTIVVPANPQKESTKEYNYTFSGWTPTVSQKVVGNAEYTAQFTGTYVEYIVRFVRGEQVITEKNYHYGDAVVLPTEEELALAGYAFVAWDKEVAQTVTENAVYTAQYQGKEYTITYNQYGGRTTNSTTTVRYGEAVTLETPVADNSFLDFLGWYDKDGKKYESGQAYNITDNLTLTPRWYTGFEGRNQGSLTSNPDDMFAYKYNHSSAIWGNKSGNESARSYRMNCWGSGYFYANLTMSYLDAFFADPDVRTMAFDVKLVLSNNTAEDLYNVTYVVNKSSLKYMTKDNHIGLIDNQYVTLYLPRSAYDSWKKNKAVMSEANYYNAFIYTGLKLSSANCNVYLDNFRQIRADEVGLDVATAIADGAYWNFANGQQLWAQRGVGNGGKVMEGKLGGRENVIKYTTWLSSSDGNSSIRFSYDTIYKLVNAGYTTVTFDVYIDNTSLTSLSSITPLGYDGKNTTEYKVSVNDWTTLTYTLPTLDKLNKSDNTSMGYLFRVSGSMGGGTLKNLVIGFDNFRFA